MWRNGSRGSRSASLSAGGGSVARVSHPTHPTVTADRLHAVTVRIWRGLGGPEEEAQLLADHLVAANLAGHDSHGVGMLPEYERSLREGGLVLGLRPQVVADTGVVVTLDARRGLGQVAAYDAMTLGVSRAAQHGAAVVALRNTHHVGRIGHWAEQCAAAGFASVHVVSVPGDAYVVPHGGSDGRLGTNPWCAAFPRPGADPVLADFATSHLSLGKTRVAHAEGRPVAPGTLLDAQGRPTTDPGAMWREPRGALLSTGEHKGSALSVLAELLAGAMAGGGVSCAETAAEHRGIRNAMLSVIIDPAAFGTTDTHDQAQALLSWVGASPPRPGAERVLLPGEPERLSRERRRADGIPIPGATWDLILGVAARAGLDPARLDPAAHDPKGLEP